MMAKLFPRPNGTRLDWKGVKEFKLTWKVSKAAILFRARQLELITEGQYKTGVITLRKYGESNGEKDDCLIAHEPPETMAKALLVLATRKGIHADDIARALHIKPTLLYELTGVANVPQVPNAIDFSEARPRHLRLVK